MKQLNFVCDKIPGPDGCVFVECEDENGNSFKAGEWRERDDGLAELVVKMPVSAEEQRVEVATADAAGYRSAMEHAAPLVKAVEDILAIIGDTKGPVTVALVKAYREFKGAE